MIRTAIDSDRLDIIMACNGLAPILLTYSDLVPVFEVLQSKLTHSKLVLIDRGLGDPSGQASVADIETGLMKPADFPGWLDKKHAAGIDDLTSYCNRSTLPEVDNAAAGKTFYRWVATLDGTCSISGFPSLRGPAAVQILPAASVGIHADLSLVFEDQWNATSEITAAEIIPAEMAVASALGMLHKLTG